MKYLFIFVLLLGMAFSCDKQGDEGPTGPTGATGTKGTNGTNGTTGVDGTTGTTGLDGAEGPAGPTGESGACIGTSLTSVTLAPPPGAEFKVGVKVVFTITAVGTGTFNYTMSGYGGYFTPVAGTNTFEFEPTEAGGPFTVSATADNGCQVGAATYPIDYVHPGWVSIGPEFTTDNVFRIAQFIWNGTPYVAYMTTGQDLYAQKWDWDANAWQALGTGPIATNRYLNASVNLYIYDGTPVVASIYGMNEWNFSQCNSFCNGQAHWYNGYSWAMLNEKPFTDPDDGIRGFSLKSYDGFPAIAYVNGSGIGRIRFCNTSAWYDPGMTPFNLPGSNAFNVSLNVDDGFLNVAYSMNLGGRLLGDAVRWESPGGAFPTPVWSPLSMTAGAPSSPLFYFNGTLGAGVGLQRLALRVLDGVPVVSFQWNNGTPFQKQIFVRYSARAFGWHDLDGITFDTGNLTLNGSEPASFVFDEQYYLAYNDNQKMVLLNYDGLMWNTWDSGNLNLDPISNLALFVNNSGPYVAYTYNGASYVKQFKAAR